MIINFEETCNLDCVFCLRRSRYDPSKKPSKAEILSKIESSDSDVLVFTGGGEPTMDKNLEEFIAFAKARGKKVILETNGIFLANQEYLMNLVEAGLSQIHLTIPSHITKIYEELTRTPGAFSYLLRALKNLKRYPNLVSQINLPFTSLNMTYEHFLGFLDFLDENQLPKNFGFHTHRPIDIQLISKTYTPDYDLLGKELIKILKYCKGHRLPFIIAKTTALPACKIKGFEDYVLSSERDLSNCYYNYASLFTQVENCEKCAIKDKCLGISKHYLFLMGFHPEPFSEVPPSLIAREKVH